MKYQKWVLAIILSALCAITTFSQKSLFEKYRFEDGGYTLAGIFAHHSDHPIQKKVGEFYTDEIAVLNGSRKRGYSLSLRINMHAATTIISWF